MPLSSSYPPDLSLEGSVKLKLKAFLLYPSSKPAPRQLSLLKGSDKLTHTEFLMTEESGHHSGGSYMEEGCLKKAAHVWTQLSDAERQAGEAMQDRPKLSLQVNKSVGPGVFITQP